MWKKIKTHIDQPFVGRSMWQRMKAEDGFLSALLTAAPAIASTVSSLFGSDKKGGAGC